MPALVEITTCVLLALGHSRGPAPTPTPSPSTPGDYLIYPLIFISHRAYPGRNSLRAKAACQGRYHLVRLLSPALQHVEN